MRDSKLLKFGFGVFLLLSVCLTGKAAAGIISSHNYPKESVAPWQNVSFFDLGEGGNHSLYGFWDVSVYAGNSGIFLPKKPRAFKAGNTPHPSAIALLGLALIVLAIRRGNAAKAQDNRSI